MLRTAALPATTPPTPATQTEQRLTSEGRAVVVTGASSGIGSAAVDVFAGAGFTVFAAVRADADAQRVAAQPGVRALQLDVTNAAGIADAANAVAASGLPLAALVNNAGIAIGGPLEVVGVDELRRQLEVNVVAPVALTQAFLPQLRAARGRIVMVGSIAGRLVAPYIAPYGASKAALRAIAAALRVELAPDGIRVVLIEPGSVETPIWQKGRQRLGDVERLTPEQRARYGAAIAALIRVLDQEERGAMPVAHVARAILRAVTAPRPRPEQVLGTGARLGSIVAVLPAAVRDGLLVRVMQLPQQ